MGFVHPPCDLLSFMIFGAALSAIDRSVPSLWRYEQYDSQVNPSFRRPTHVTGLYSRFSGVLVDGVKHLGKRPANGFTGRPPCKGFGHRVHDGDVAIAVYCYDFISYTLSVTCSLLRSL